MNNEEFEKIEELQEYADLDGSEVGEGLWSLIDMNSVKHYLNKEFKEAVDREIDLQLKWFRDNTVIKSKTEIIENEKKWLEFK